MNRKSPSILMLAVGLTPCLASCAYAQADEVDKNEALWIQLDRNESGWLSGNELNGGWVKYDTNADGEVTKAEFMTGRAAEAPAAQPRAQAQAQAQAGNGATTEEDRVQDAILFVKLDISGEGYLDGDELQDGTFQHYDANADGRVVLAEFAAGRAKDRLAGATTGSAKTVVAQDKPVPTVAQDKPVVRDAPPGKAAPTRSLPAALAIEGGLYFKINSYFAFGQLNISQEHFTFWPDGRLYFGTPPGGLEFFDFEVARQKEPSKSGTYSIAGDKITFSRADGKSTTHGFKRVPGGFNLDGIFTSRQKSYKTNERIAGHYDGGASVGGGGNGAYVAAVKSLTFAADGTFQGSVIGAIGANTATGTVTGGSETADSGTYSLSGNTLTLRHQGGPVTRHTVYPYDLGEGKTAINVDGVMLHRRR